MTSTMTKTKLPAFKGKPLIKIQEFVPQAGFLEGDFGKSFMEEYEGRVNSDYSGNPALNTLKYNSGVVGGSNPFAVVLGNQILSENALRVATQADLEKALGIGWDLRGTYEDTGLVLRTDEDLEYARNTPLAQDLGRQFKLRGIKFSPRNPLVIPLTGLELEKADNSYGLTFRLKDDAEVYGAPILSQEENFNSEDVDEKTGLPKKVAEEGSRRLYTRNSGLSRLGLDDYLGLGSDYRSLGISGGVGRVVVVSGEATRAEDFMERINTEYQTQLDELNSRKAEAEKAVREIMNRKR